MKKCSKCGKTYLPGAGCPKCASETSPSSFPWVKNGSGWILSGGKIVAKMGGCTQEDDCNARVIEAAGDMLDLTRRIAKGGMSYPTYDRKLAESILRKIFPENETNPSVAATEKDNDN
jgi:hypothetical protein